MSGGMQMMKDEEVARLNKFVRACVYEKMKTVWMDFLYPTDGKKGDEGYMIDQTAAIELVDTVNRKSVFDDFEKVLPQGRFEFNRLVAKAFNFEDESEVEAVFLGKDFGEQVDLVTLKLCCCFEKKINIPKPVMEFNSKGAMKIKKVCE